MTVVSSFVIRKTRVEELGFLLKFGQKLGIGLQLNNSKMNTAFLTLLCCITLFCSLSSGSRSRYDWKKEEGKMNGQPPHVRCRRFGQDINVDWTPPLYFNGEVIGYNVYYWKYKEGREDTRTKTTFAPKTVLHGLPAYTAFLIEVSAFNEDGSGPRSVKTGCLNYDGEKPCESIEVEDMTNTTITVKWTCSSTEDIAITGYNLNYFSLTVPEKVYEVNLKDNDLSSYTLKNVSSEETYEIYFEAFKGNWNPISVQSELVRTTLDGIIPIRPCTPNLKITSKTHDSVSLKWKCETAHTTAVEGYKLHGYFIEVIEREGSSVTEIDSSYTTYTLMNLKCGKIYSFAIESYDKNGTHERSKIVNTKLGDQVHRPPSRKEYVEIGEDRVILKLGEWKFGCPYGVVFASISSTKGRASRSVQTVNLTVTDRIMFQHLQPNNEYNLTMINQESGESDSFQLKTL